MNKETARQLLKQRGLRITGPRLAVIQLLAEARTPLSYSEVLKQLGDTDWDDATIYRNLIKLGHVGITPVVTRAEGIDRYAFVANKKDEHQHPHFVCDLCGRIACLPKEITMKVEEKDQWAASIRNAKVQLSGNCPECIETSP